MVWSTKHVENTFFLCFAKQQIDHIQGGFMCKIWSSSFVLQLFLGGVPGCDLIYHIEGTGNRTPRNEVPGGTLDRCSEPGGAEAENKADAAQQVRDHPSHSVILFEFCQGPTFCQRVVEEGQRCKGLQHRHPQCQHAKDTVPGSQMRFAIQVLVVIDGHYTQDCTRHTETLQDPVKTTFSPVCKPLDGGAMRRENENGFWHEEGKLMGHKWRQSSLLPLMIWCVGWMTLDLQLASSKKGARKTNLKQDKSHSFYSKKRHWNYEQNKFSRRTHLNPDDSEV